MSCMPELCLDALDEDFLTVKKHFVLNCLLSFCLRLWLIFCFII